MKTKKCRCSHCKCLFVPCRKVKKQDYCSKKGCQLARKRNWQKSKLQNDPTYREEQRSAQKDWRSNNPDYWKKYRQKNKQYADSNREKQRLRNCRRRQTKGNFTPLKKIAKMDALLPKNNRLSGRYKLVPFEPEVIAKMDAIIVEINTISDTCSSVGG